MHNEILIVCSTMLYHTILYFTTLYVTIRYNTKRYDKIYGYFSIHYILLYYTIRQDTLLYYNEYCPVMPVVAHKAVAEVSKIGHYRRGELL